MKESKLKFAYQFHPYSTVIGISGEWFYADIDIRCWSYQLYLGPVRFACFNFNRKERYSEEKEQWITTT